MSDACQHCHRRRRNTLLGATLAVLVAGPVLLSASSVGPLVVFANGTTADALDVNANFAAVKAAIDDNDARILKNNIVATTAPGHADDRSDGYSVGSIWVDTQADVPYMCVDATVGAAIWSVVGATDALAPDGSSAAQAALSCLDLHADHPNLPDGPYWLDPDGGSVVNAQQRWCDMTSDGGGWTMIAYNFNVSRTFLTGTYHPVPGPTLPTDGEEWASDPLAFGLTYTEIGFYTDDPQWDDPSRSYHGFWAGEALAHAYDLMSNDCQVLYPTDPANQWAGSLVYFAGDGASDDGCRGNGSALSGHTCDDGGGGITTNNVWPTNASDPLWGYNCISSYSPTGAYKRTGIPNLGLHAYYVR